MRADEYIVKWNLRPNAALRQRRDEALAHVVVPVKEKEEDTSRAVNRVAQTIVPATFTALPVQAPAVASLAHVGSMTSRRVGSQRRVMSPRKATIHARIPAMSPQMT